MLELVPAGTNIDFVGKRRVALALSLALVAVSAVAALPQVRGVRLGIDFAGGTEVLVAFPQSPEVSEGPIRQVVSACGIPESSVVRYGEAETPEFLLRFQAEQVAAPAGDDTCPITAEQREQLERLREELGSEGGARDQGEIVDRLRYALANRIGPVEIERVEFVGPRVGAELRQDGLLAIFWACFFMLIYIGFRFSLRFAPGAVIALVHDIAITAGLFVIFGLEFDLTVLAALLAILGYSLNDTIIIYDRIRENMELRTKHDLPEVINRSVNQTLSRTALTSGTTLAAVLALLFLGGEVIRPFAVAMTIGIVVGTYSSIYIAAPVLLFLEDWFGEEGQKPGRKAAPPQRAPGSRGGKSRKGTRAATL
jgi:preprotein translocase subunit SecF